jgi:hypothetical protein
VVVVLVLVLLLLREPPLVPATLLPASLVSRTV